MVDTVVIDQSKEDTGLSLEAEAQKMGITPESIDPTAQSQSAPTRPEWLPPEFKTVDEFRAAYDAMKAGKSEDPGDDPENTDGDGDQQQEEQKDDTPQTEEQKVKADLKAKGVDVDQMSAKFWEKGALDPEDYETLDKAGYPKWMVDQFAEGQKAKVELQRQTVFARAGGEANYEAMRQWAAKTFTPAEAAQYTAAVDSGDMSKVLFAVEGLKARYEAANGREPTNTVSGRTSRAEVAKYESVAQMKKDMADPRYKSDPAFRRRVEQKVAASSIL